MQPEDREAVLWALSELGERAQRDDAPVPDSTLLAYRAGRLAGDEERRVERLLAHNPTLRHRLEELAGRSPEQAPAKVRRAILEKPFRSPLGQQRSWRRAPAYWPGLAAAAMMILIVGSINRWMVPTAPGHEPLPPYEVRIDGGLVDRRGAPEPGDRSQIATFAETRLTVTAVVTRQPIDGVEVALYRVLGDRLVKVIDDVERSDSPGLAAFETRADRLAGPAPGTYEVFVTIAWRGDLPAVIPLATEDDPGERLTAGGKRQVHRLTLRLLAESSATPSDDGDPATDEEVNHVTYFSGGGDRHRAFDFRRSRRHRFLGSLRIVLSKGR